ncbi:MAG: NAD(P)/FAD-dependent oxidoreductase [Candidatus Goldbacteria bacterium]|nr:NAD(P)/FAD-dependent oxidoreductase [Candidatus Goldiibacteriota bacterium]
MRIGIVGAGIAGLTAGYRLAKNGYEVTIFEKDTKIGGLAKSFDFSGNKLDCFYRHIFKSDIDIIRLIDELNLTNDLIWKQVKMGFYYMGKTYNFTTPIDLLLFTPLPFFDRIKLGLISLFLKDVKDWKQFEKITAKEWIIKNFGSKIYDIVWGPLLTQKFAEKADKISMTWLYGRIAARFKSRGSGGIKEVLGYLKGSFQKLIDTLADEIKNSGGKIYSGLAVNKINYENKKVKGLTAAGKNYDFDGVIVTCAPALIKTMIDVKEAGIEKSVNAIDYHGSVALVFSSKKSLGDIYWLNVADKQSPFVAVVEHTNFITRENYNGNVIIYIGKYLSIEEELYKLPDLEIKNRFFSYLKNINPLFDEKDVIEWVVIKEPWTQPIVPVNYSDIKMDYKCDIKGLYFANMSMIYPEDRGMSYSVKLGNEVIEIIKNDFEKGDF